MVTPIDPKVELEIDSVWYDVTGDVYERDAISISRGRQNEGTKLNPASCALTFDNRTGDYSPRNPSGAYYGFIGRNNQLRVSVPFGESFLRLPGTANSRMTTADKATLDITGDLDVRVDITLEDWRNAQGLAGKYLSTGNQRSWYLITNDSGTLTLAWSTDGTLANVLSSSSTTYVPNKRGRLAVRATIDVNNGAAGHTVTFYTSDSISGSWTQLGDAVVTSGTTSIFSSSADLEVGHLTSLSTDPCYGKVHAFQLYNGIAGTVVANPNLAIQTAGAASFADTAGTPNTWAMNGASSVDNREYRFWGEVSSWTPRSDLTGNDAYTQVEAAGLTRRLGQGVSPLDSVMYRALTRVSDSPVRAYWPLEDGTNSTVLSSPLPNATAMTFIGSPALASNSEFVASSDILVMDATSALTGRVPTYTSTNEIQVRFLLRVPSGGLAATTTICSISATGTARTWELYCSTTGSLGLRGFDDGGVSVGDTGLVAFAVNGKKLRVSVEIQPSGGNVAWGIVTLEQGATTGSSTSGAVFAGTVGKAKTITIGVAGGMTDTVVGHVSLQDNITSIFDLSTQFVAYNGENPLTRVQRLCTEEEITYANLFQSESTSTNDVTMGYQGADTLLDLVNEAETTDLGLLYEAKDALALGYRTRLGMYNQTALLTLDYDANQLADALTPVDDDSLVRNDVTVTRRTGAQARSVLESGTLSVEPPPDGIGRYTDSLTLSIGDDDQAVDQAAWRLHLGTIDEARYPSVSLNLRHSTFTSSTTKRQATLFVDTGDRVVVSDPPSWLPPDDISVLVYGYAERISGQEHTMTLNCVPESGYRVGYANMTDDQDTDYGRADTEDSTINEDLTTTETDVGVATNSGPVWTTAAGDLPFDIVIGGEVMRVTAVSGSTSPQTFTVTRSVNGVVKTHSTGADVRLAYPTYVSL